LHLGHSGANGALKTGDSVVSTNCRVKMDTVPRGVSGHARSHEPNVACATHPMGAIGMRARGCLAVVLTPSESRGVPAHHGVFCRAPPTATGGLFPKPRAGKRACIRGTTVTRGRASCSRDRALMASGRPDAEARGAHGMPKPGAGAARFSGRRTIPQGSSGSGGACPSVAARGHRGRLREVH
jgi:hypothetical protein